VLSQREQHIWDEIERSYGIEADAATTVLLDERQEPAIEVEDVPARLIAGVSAVVVGLWVTIVLVLVGALVAATAVGAATTVAWLLVRRSPSSQRADRAAS
jgi:hypothetical protein